MSILTTLGKGIFSPPKRDILTAIYLTVNTGLSEMNTKVLKKKALLNQD